MNSDKTFSSPSSVADFCIGSSNNGWIVWKDKHGNTLDSVNIIYPLLINNQPNMICPKINWKIYSQLHRLNLWTYMQWILYKILYFQYIS